ncbi:MAG TPA: aminotransferase class V-fold PLP-dependent enzyme [Burkholderiales bacterium]|nr:aminotransferase class V-fold PLP-dependent enzyme [Burkholderiales bacterium]
MAVTNWTALRDEFPTLKHWTYLDVARKTLPPRCQEEAVQEYYRDVYENAGADAWSALNVAQTRSELAQLLGAKPAEIAFTRNTTDGLNIAAHAFPLAPGDNIVLTDMEHLANRWVWKHWEHQGVEIRYAKSDRGRLPLQTFLAQMDTRTRVVSTAYITYGNGYRVNLPELGAACRERDIRLVVDGVQASGILATPLSELGADIVAIGGHKGLLGLTGSGIVFCREELVNTLRTPFLKEPEAPGSATARAHVNSQFDYVRVAHRFEGGNPNFLGIRVLRSGARFLQSIGLSHIEGRVRELTQFCLQALRKSGLETATPAAWEERGQIVNVLVSNADSIMETLRERDRIIVNVKDKALRISMSFFNHEEDIEKAVRAIAREAGTRKVAAA